MITRPHFRIALAAALLLQLRLPAQQKNAKLDSLRKVYPALTTDTSRVNTLNLISRQLFVTGKYDSAEVCAANAKAMAEKNDYRKGLAIALNNLGNICLNKGKQEEALQDYTTALKIQQQIAGMPGVKKGLAASYSNIGGVYVGKGNYDEALRNFFTALDIRRELGDKTDLAISYTNIGVVYYYQGNYPEALKSYLVALDLEKQTGDKLAISRTYNNSGNIYFQQKNYPAALSSYFSAMDMQKQIGDLQGVGRSYNNIGAVYFEQGHYDNALRFFLIALRLKTANGDRDGQGRSFLNIGNACFIKATKDAADEAALLDLAELHFRAAFNVLQEVGDKQGMAMSYNNLGALYIRQHKAAAAIENITKGLAMAKAIGSKEDTKAGYFEMASADSMQGDWRSAYENHKQFLLYRDSLINEENTKKTVQAQMNFDFEQKESRARDEQEKKEALYREKLKRQQVIGWSAAGLLVLLLLISLLLFNRHRLRQKNSFQEKLNKQQKEQAAAVMETQEMERKRIAEDLHDSLGHLLSTIRLNLQTLPEEQKKYYVSSLQLLNQASTEIRNISFNLMPQTLEEEGLIAALNELADKIRSSRLYDIILQVHDMDQFTLDKQTKFNIYRIVQEAVNNILKHADAREINIQLINRKDYLTIMIEDDGKGFNTQEVKMNGRGLNNITARSEWLDGTISIDSTPGRGTTIVIEIPIQSK